MTVSNAPAATAVGGGGGQPPPDAWRPPVVLDLNTASPQALEVAASQLKLHFAQHPVSALALTMGWHTITPEVALGLLARNRGNRRLMLSAIRKYARSMREGVWKKTGQPLVFDRQGQLSEGQHRLYACLWGGHAFTTMVVTDASDEPDIFAFIDNGAPRTAADALFTAGANGCSKQVASATIIAARFEAGAFRINSLPRMEQMQPWEVMAYVEANPSLVAAAHTVVSNFSRAAKVIGHMGAATFFAWQVIERYGLDELDAFLTPLGTAAPGLAEDNPIRALLERLRAVEGPHLAMQQRLALLIKAFGLHYSDDTVVVHAPPRRRGQPPQPTGLFLADNEEFPQFPPVEAAREAA